MKKNEDIAKLTFLLRDANKTDIANLLSKSTSYLNKSTNIGKKLFSKISTFEIYSPPSENKKLASLPEEDKSLILECVKEIYPDRNYEPEIRKIEYRVDLAKLDEANLLKHESLDTIDYNYIKEQINKCENKIHEKDYEGAITNARNLLESICLYIIENLDPNKENDSSKGDLMKLYKKVSNAINLAPNNDMENPLKKILSSLIALMQGLSELRNKFSDAHGTAPSNQQHRIDKSHARLAVNSAITISEYLYTTFENKNKS